jgi:hypothetical protein
MSRSPELGTIWAQTQALLDRLIRPAPDGNALEASPRAAVPTCARTWAALMHRVFALDALACPRCGGRLRGTATVQDCRRWARMAWTAKGALVP